MKKTFVKKPMSGSNLGITPLCEMSLRGRLPGKQGSLTFYGSGVSGEQSLSEPPWAKFSDKAAI